MVEFIELALAASLIAVVGYAAYRALILFEITVQRGQLVRARGRMPQALLNDFLGVCPRGLEARLLIRCRIEQGRARLTAKGPLTDDAVQQLRNLLGLWPLARLKAAPRFRR